ncbi:MAG: NfeD family protein [Oscillospiraceae bacterium]|nr:NfeD family protein [Oscillospiraceae bacterium]
MDTTMIWILLAVGFLIMEFVTVALISLWFVVGSLAALIASVLGAAFWVQLLLFALVALVLLLLVRPFLQRFVTPHKVATNIDALVGQEAVVTEKIDNLDGTGTVKLNGLTWSARSAGGEEIPVGALVTVQAVQGVKLIVQPLAAEL